ncbi:hypothetical protein LRS03_06180 [Rhizobacter sp. J219]|uniref:hypothetical protein n=1 Tax=Rhizobacter sp. J219 TaxID=2898430 RepID=UPI002150D2AF|nr:hypothetical protein [Rhizobacter sp. J219]MCR5882472.1 hypothetical protein [Rhizobacter sp. J219]
MAKPELFFSDGVAVDGEQFFFGAGMHEHRDSDSSVIGCLLDGEWGYHSVEDDFITSITFVPERQEVVALGKNGLVKTATPRNAKLVVDNMAGRFKAEQLAGAEEAGPLERIRAIGSSVFACGWAGQIYRRSGGAWEQFDLGKKAKNHNFMAIDGFSETDVYAVGLKGVIWHFDGQKWRSVDSPTNQALYDVRCLPNGDLVTCGAEGGVFRGKGQHLQSIGDPSFEGNCWAVEEFKGKLYLTLSENRLAVLSQGSLHDVKLHAKEPRTTYRLSATSDALYSFGPFDIARFDGRKWHDVICPENT